MSKKILLVVAFALLAVSSSVSSAQTPCVWPNEIVLRDSPTRFGSAVLVSAYRYAPPSGNELGIAVCNNGVATFEVLVAPVSVSVREQRLSPSGKFVYLMGYSATEPVHLLYPLNARVPISATLPLAIPVPSGRQVVFWGVSDQGEVLGGVSDSNGGFEVHPIACTSVGCREFTFPGWVASTRSYTTLGRGRFGEGESAEPFLLRDGMAFRSNVPTTREWHQISNAGNILAGYNLDAAGQIEVITTNLDTSRPASWYKAVGITSNGTTPVKGDPTGVLDRYLRSDGRKVTAVFYQPWDSFGPRVWSGTLDGTYPSDQSFSSWYASETGAPLTINGTPVSVSGMIGVNQSGKSCWLTVVTSLGYAVIHVAL